MTTTPAQRESAIDRRTRGSLRRFQAVSYVVGCFLLALCVAMVLKYVANSPGMMSIVGPMHGFGYMVYLALAFDLSRVAGWSLRKTILVLLAGTVPLMSFVAERLVTRELVGKGS